MHRLRRLLRPRWVHAGAWTLATGAAVTLSWCGVHTVLSGTSYDPPRALPVSEAPDRHADPRSSSTHRPRPDSPSPSPSGTPAGKPDRGKVRPGSSRTPTPPPEPPDTVPSTGSVKGTTVPGGRAVFDLGRDSATLVSATPDPGWDMRIWNESRWIRVTFTDGNTTWSVFCRWEDGNPRVETFNG